MATSQITLTVDTSSLDKAVTVVDALESAKLALLANNRLLVTDRPDLPRSDETSWVSDHTHEIALIDRALETLGINSDTGLEYLSRSSGLSTEPT